MCKKFNVKRSETDLIIQINENISGENANRRHKATNNSNKD